MKMEPVKSSQIQAIGYDAAQQLLRVQFHPKKDEKEGVMYEYSRVTPEIHQALMSAESLGRFFGTVIRADKKAFPFRVIPAAKA